MCVLCKRVLRMQKKIIVYLYINGLGKYVQRTRNATQDKDRPTPR